MNLRSVIVRLLLFFVAALILPLSASAQSNWTFCARRRRVLRICRHHRGALRWQRRLLLQDLVERHRLHKQRVRRSRGWHSQAMRYRSPVATTEYLDLLRAGRRVLRICRHHRGALRWQRRVFLQDLVERHRLHKQRVRRSRGWHSQTMRYRGRVGTTTESLDLLRAGRRVLRICRHHRGALRWQRCVHLQDLVERHRLHKQRVRRSRGWHSQTMRYRGRVGTTTEYWTFCAPEGGFCAFAGTTEVRYGGNGVYTYKTLSNGTACTNSVFGDPVAGTAKQCAIGADVAIATPAAASVRIGGWPSADDHVSSWRRRHLARASISKASSTSIPALPRSV